MLKLNSVIIYGAEFVGEIISVQSTLYFIFTLGGLRRRNSSGLVVVVVVVVLEVISILFISTGVLRVSRAVTFKFKPTAKTSSISSDSRNRKM